MMGQSGRTSPRSAHRSGTKGRTVVPVAPTRLWHISIVHVRESNLNRMSMYYVHVRRIPYENNTIRAAEEAEAR